MTHLRRALGLLSAAALVVTLAPGIAQADERKGPVPVPTDGPALAVSSGPRSGIIDGTDALSQFFAGHLLAAADATVNEATFQVHDWECGADSDGVLSSILTFDDAGFFNGGPGIFMYCDGGAKTYAPVFLDFGFGQQPIAEPVAAGDWVRMSATREGGVATYTMENITAGWEESATGTDDFVNGFVQTGDNAILLDDQPVGPPAFGRDAVRNVVFDGTPLSESDSTKVQMVAEDGTTVIERATKHRAILADERFSLINKT